MRFPGAGNDTGAALGEDRGAVRRREAEEDNGDVPTSSDRQPHVVVVGAGFAGLARQALARAGRRRHPDRPPPYKTFQPLLYQVATGGLNPGDITYALRGVRRRSSATLRFRQGTVVTGSTPRTAGAPATTATTSATTTWSSPPGSPPTSSGSPGGRGYSLPIYTRARGPGDPRPPVRAAWSGSPPTSRHRRVRQSWSSAAAPPASRWRARWPRCGTSRCRGRPRARPEDGST